MQRNDKETTYIKRTFRTGMHRTSAENRERYGAIKNKLLSYKNADGNNIRNIEYKRFSVFYDGNSAVAKIGLNGKTLKIVFPTDEREDGDVETDGYKIKLKSDKALDAALKKIEELALSRDLTPDSDYKPMDFAAAPADEAFLKGGKKTDEETATDETVFLTAADAVIEAVGLTSCEHTSDGDGYKPLLRDVDLEIKKGEIVGIGGNDFDEIRILCEILGNMRPYYKGYLKLGPVGVYKDKRLLLKHIFYIDNDEMLYGKMTVLEQLLFSVNVKGRENAVKRQRETLNLLVENGLDSIALKKIGDLTRGQKMLVALFLAGISESLIIIANLLDYTLSQEEIEMLRGEIDFLKSRGKTVVLATLQPKLIGMTCEKVLFLLEGKVEYLGTVKQLTDTYDKVVCLLRGADLEVWAGIINQNMPGYNCSVEDGTLFVSNYNETEFDETELFRLFEKHGVKPDFIKINRGRVENSFKELMIKYDI